MAVSLTKAYFIAMFCEAVLHGMYTVLAGGALYLLLRKRRPQRLEPINVIMITLIMLMYCMSTVHIALALQVNLIAFFNQHAIEGGLTILDDQGNPLVWVQIMLELLNCVMGDAIVCWRTWVLWGRDWRILIFPIVCIFGGLVSGSGMTRALSTSPKGAQLYSGNITIWFGFFGVLTCIANLYSVVMISYKVWSNTRAMKRLNVHINGGRYYSAVLLIIESGALYCIALILTVILFLTDNNGVYVVADMLNHLTGIYPTIIIVLVCLKITFADDMSRAETTLPSLTASSGASHNHLRKPSSQRMLSWRVGNNSNTSSESRGVGDSNTADAYGMKPIKITTVTDRWYDRDGLQDSGIRATDGYDTLSKKVPELGPEEVV